MYRRPSYAAAVASSNPPTRAPNHAQSASSSLNSSSNNNNSNSNAAAAPPPSHHARRPPSRPQEASDGRHSSSMPASWGRPHAGLAGSSLPGPNMPRRDTPPPPRFFTPSYLQGSRHAEKLEDLHRAKAQAQREAWPPAGSHSGHSGGTATGSLSTSASSAGLAHKAMFAPRGIVADVSELPPPLLDGPVAPWPTVWSESDKHAQLDLDDAGREVKFSGSQRGHDEAAAVRADHPMPRQCGLYYYEVTVISKGKDRTIGVGFSAARVPLTRIPGWEAKSYAYHGDDGQSFSGSTSGKPYGPKFGTLDVIGCGINFRKNTAFFTKNGHYLGTAFTDLKTDEEYYPTVGMKKPGETVRANFGQEPFAFDIDKMVQEQKADIMTEIRAASPRVADLVVDHFADETSFVHWLVRQYLTHDGYVESARAFSEEINQEARALASDGATQAPYVPPVEDLDAINRQKIRAAILDGNIDQALKHTNVHYPSVLRDNENIYFKLKCRKFIEMIRSTNELHDELLHNSKTHHTRSETQRHTHSTADGGFDFEMELDDSSTQPPSSFHPSYPDDDGPDPDPSGPAARHEKLTNDTIQYGMELKMEFASDPRREVKRALEDTFALIAYENVGDSLLAPLLDVKGRVPVAEELNSAILVSLGKSSSAALERLTQQTDALVSELAGDGGSGAFINVRRDILM